MATENSLGCLLTIAFFVVMIGLAAVNNPSDADMAQGVEGYGFSDVKIEGPSFLGCGQKDWFQRKFTATNPAGHRVEGVICSGLLKAYTVRIVRSHA